jgi:hypothetical protein
MSKIKEKSRKKNYAFERLKKVGTIKLQTDQMIHAEHRGETFQSLKVFREDFAG